MGSCLSQGGSFYDLFILDETENDEGKFTFTDHASNFGKVLIGTLGVLPFALDGTSFQSTITFTNPFLVLNDFFLKKIIIP